jgi:hypothetical protein
MNNAGLDDRVREHGVDRLGKALQPIDHRDQDIADAAVTKRI